MERDAAGSGSEPESHCDIRMELAGTSLLGRRDIRVHLSAIAPIQVEQMLPWDESPTFERLQVDVGKVKLRHADSNILPIDQGGGARIQIVRERRVGGSRVPVQKG